MRTLPIFLAFALVPLQAQVPEVRTTAKDRVGLSVTIYQNGLAAIRDTRRINLPAGPSRLAFSDLVPTLRPKSATLLDPGLGIQVRERNYEFNLLSPASLVEASLGATVGVKNERGVVGQTGRLVSKPLLKRRIGLIATPTIRNVDEDDGSRPITPPPPPPPPIGYEPQLLGEDDDDTEPLWRQDLVILQRRDPKVLLATKDGFLPAKPSAIEFQAIPLGLLASPTIFQFLEAEGARPNDLTLLYTAEQFEWSCHYEATLSTSARELDLRAFARIKNSSGAPLVGTSLQLIAGEPHLVEDPPPEEEELLDGVPGGVIGGVVGGVVDGPPIFREEKLSEYPLFTLDRPITIEDKQEKQIALLHAENIPVRTTFLVGSAPQDYSTNRFQEDGPLFQLRPPSNPGAIRGWVSRRQPTVYRLGTIQNIKLHQLGRALPKGSVTVRYQDASGVQIALPGSGGHSSEFPQTAPGEDIELMFGPARGLHVDRYGTSCKSAITKPHRNSQGRLRPQRRWIYSVQIHLKNDLDEVANITVREPLKTDWELKSASHTGHRAGPNAWDFQVRVQPHQVTQLTYTVRTSPEEISSQTATPDVEDPESEALEANESSTASNIP
ncbi:DUF4139 domain-containing protein [Geothrix sp. PMB-07]|uniref:DUF4139 domain-containing protein n=1 Tax=Geothrix sp. PMB-07 TaxID=3068640 RepID=UPI002741D213|nr:DUF4139 domain-containing protein [Geothrix sp. PMB-07]WLT32877.1 DUF4139 domain-containing protein [Geothrix sp. PMB-07]